MATTPTYGFHYPAQTDPPNGAAQIQQLATDVEAKFVTNDALIAQHIPQFFEAATSADTILTTSTADLTGGTLTFSTTVTNAIAIVDVMWDLRIFITGTGYCYGEVAVDGVTDSRKSLFVAQTAETRFSGYFRKKYVLASAGSHTIKLQGHKDSSGGTGLFCGGTTVLSVSLYQ